MPSSVSLQMSQIYIYKVKSATLQKLPMRNIHNKFNIFKFSFKGYLRYKTILCYKVALDVQLMIFFI